MTMEEVKKRGLKVVKSRWVNTRKALPDDPGGVRSRLVAQEINVGPRNGTFAGTPPLWVHRSVVSEAATATMADKGKWQDTTFLSPSFMPTALVAQQSCHPRTCMMESIFGSFSRL
jgi:hypothetical protein